MKKQLRHAILAGCFLLGGVAHAEFDFGNNLAIKVACQRLKMENDRVKYLGAKEDADDKLRTIRNLAECRRLFPNAQMWSIDYGGFKCWESKACYN